jgi:transposase
VDSFKTIRWKGQSSKLNEYKDIIDKDFENNPPKSINEAQERIEKLTGIKRSPTQIQLFIKKLNYRYLKMGSIPGNGDGEDEKREEMREDFKKKELEPRLEQAKKGERIVLFVDAVHFIFSTLLGSIWCKTRCFLRSQAGRKRYSILGAINAISKKMTYFSTDATVNAKSVCKLLKMIYLEYYGSPITIVLDNARYQHCKLVKRYARVLGIELLFLPAYSPNLNIIERFWKYTKKKILYSIFHENYEIFKNRIDNCIKDAFIKDAEKLNSLLTLKFQSFKKVKILPV